MSTSELQRTLTFADEGIAVVSRHVASLDWLEEFLGPWFRVTDDPDPAYEVSLEAEGAFRDALMGAERVGDEVHCFTLDTGTEPWQSARGPKNLDVVIEDRMGIAVVRVHGDALRLGILADEERPHGRMTLMRVLRELATAEAVRGGALHIHAAGVEEHGGVTLFSGAKRAGKTSLLLYALHQDGTRFVTNDRALVTPGDEPLVVGMPTIVSLREGAIQRWPALEAELRTGAWHFPATVEESKAHRRDGTRVEPPSRRPIPGLSGAQLCELVGVEAVRGGPLARIVLPTVDTSVDGFVMERLAPDDAARRVFETGLIANGRVADYFGEPPVYDPDQIQRDVERLTAAVPCVSCVMGPGAYDSPALWEAIRSA